MAMNLCTLLGYYRLRRCSEQIRKELIRRISFALRVLSLTDAAIDTHARKEQPVIQDITA